MTDNQGDPVPARFNSPPGWPTPAEGWAPPAGWRPDPSWPSAPAGWQFWIDDAEPFPVPQAAQRQATATSTAGRSLTPAEICGWGGLVVTVVVALLTGGFSSGLIFLGLYAGVVGIIALIRGQVGWARLSTRRAGSAATGLAVAALIIGSATAPAPVSDTNSVDAETTLTATVSPSAKASPTISPAKSSSGTIAPLIAISTRPATANPKPAAAKPRPTAKPKPARKKPKPAKTASKSSRCDPNYAGACVPIASDVDCAGGSGNGPAYFSGVAKVVGTDKYHLDADGDGFACE